jgi:IPT/TIG domain
MSVLHFSMPAPEGRARCSRVGMGAPDLVRRALTLCSAAAIAMFVATASASASCPQPQGSHYQGTYETEREGGIKSGSGTFDAISKEFTVLGPEELSFNSITKDTGQLFGKAVTAQSVVHGGLLRCEGPIGVEEIPLEEQSGEIEGFGPFTATGHAKGTFTATEIAGESENNFKEKTRYFGVFDPNAGSAGIEPGSVEVISPFGTVASEFSVAPATGAQLPPGTVAPAGALAFSVSGVPANGTIVVALVLPPGSTPTAVYKPVGGGVYEEYPASKTVLLGNVIDLELTDNESPWDEDPTPGVIRDPAVPVQPTAGGMVPSIKKLTAKKGAAETETTVTITGANFTGSTAVRFGTEEATSFKVNSVGSITAVSPKGKAGKVPVFVANGAGVSAESRKAQFTFKKQKKKK